MKTIKGRVLEGVVISDKMDKTITVRVAKRFNHPLYKKYVLRRKTYKVHDEEKKAKTGNIVKIVESKPYSKDKRFKLVGIVR